MSGFVRCLTAAVLAISLCMVPTAAIAAAPAAPNAAAPTQAVNPWVTLSAMAGSRAASEAAAVAAARNEDDGCRREASNSMAVGRSGASPTAAAAAQDDDNDRNCLAPWPSLAVILATIATGIYIVLKDDDQGGKRFVEFLVGGSLFGEPISPA